MPGRNWTIQIGAYAPGHDGELDAAVQNYPHIVAMLQQDMHERAPFDDCLQRLQALAR